MEGGEGIQDDAAVEPEEEDRQWQFTPESGEQREPLIAMSDGRDDVEPRIT
jgi:hypothetical protein